MADEPQLIGPEAIAAAKAIAAEYARIEEIQGNIRSEAEKKLFIDQQTLVASREELKNIAEAKVKGDELVAQAEKEITLLDKKSTSFKAQEKALKDQIALIRTRQGLSDEYVGSLRDASDELDQALTKTQDLENATRRAAEATTGIGEAWKQSASGAFLNTVKTEGFVTALKSAGAGLKKTFTMENMAGSLMTGVVQQTMKAVMGLDNARASVAKSLGSGKQYDAVITDVYTSSIDLGVSSGDAAQAVQGLAQNMAGFGTMSKAAQKDMVAYTATMQEIGVDAATSGQFLTNTTKVMGLTRGESKALGAELGGLANHLGVSVGSITSDFNGVMGDLAIYGKQAPKVFKKLAGAAAALGVSVDGLVGSMKDLDTVSGAAAAAGKMNAALGGQFMDTNQLLNASYEERILLIKKGLDASGKDFASMSRAEKQMVASASGMKDVGELAKYMNTSVDDLSKSMSDAGEATGSMDDMKDKAAAAQSAQERLTQAMESLAIAVGPITDLFKFFADVMAAIVMNPFGKWAMIIAGALYFMGGPLVKVVLGFKAFFASLIAGALKVKAFVVSLWAKVGALRAAGLASAWNTVKTWASAAADKAAALAKGASTVAQGASTAAVVTDTGVKGVNAAATQGMAAANVQATTSGGGFIAYLKALLTTITPNIAALLALGFTFLMIGAGVAIAAYGVSLLVASFAGFSAGEILAIAVALAVFGATMVGMAMVLAGLVTSGALPLAAAGLYAFGAAMLMVGIAMFIAAAAFNLFVAGFLMLLPHLPQFGLFALQLMLLAVAGMLMLPGGIMAMIGLIMMAVGIAALGLALKLVSSDDLRSLGMMMTGLGQVAQYAGAGISESVPAVKALMNTLDDMSNEIASSIWLFSALGAAFMNITSGAIGALMLGLSIRSIGAALGTIPLATATMFMNLLETIGKTTDAAVERINTLADAVWNLGYALDELNSFKMYQFTMMVEHVGTLAQETQTASPEVAERLVAAAQEYSEIKYDYISYSFSDPFERLLKSASSATAGQSGGSGSRSGFQKKEEATVVVLQLDGRELGRSVEKVLGKKNNVKSIV